MRHGQCLLALCLLAPSLALATFPGANGQIAYRGFVDYGQSNGAQAIFSTTTGQLVAIDNSASPSEYDDGYPAWSPDGSQLAFVRIDNTPNVYSLDVVDQTGGNLRTVVQSSAFGPPGTYFSELAWTPDGKSITFLVSTHLNAHSLYSVNLDGSGLSLAVDANYPSSPSWSSRGELAYQCQFRYWDPQQTVPYDDICYIDTNGALHQIAVDLPAAIGYREIAQSLTPNWSPAGDKILLTISWHTATGRGISHSDVFWLNEADNTLTQLTNPADACPSPDFGGTSNAQRLFYGAAPSPDGKSIVALGYHINDEQVSPNACLAGLGTSDQAGLWQMDLNGHNQSLFFATNGNMPTWQPVPKGISLSVLDGHGHPIDGAQVDIRDTFSDAVLQQGPLNQGVGTYTFPNALAAGKYVARVTLMDNCGTSCTAPAFDVQYAPDGTVVGAAWAEFPFTVQSSTQLTSATLDFANSPLSSASLDAGDYGRVSDMAAIFYYMHQYVRWVQANLTASTGSTVHYLTFAESDPTDPAGPETLDPKYTAYVASLSSVLMGTASSEYATREPGSSDADHDHDGPENEEWHEYTHYLYDTLLGLDCAYATAGAPNRDTNHGGWSNPDTCDSMDEGFATFLPTLAGQSIFGTSSDVYAGMADLSGPWMAWGTASSGANTVYREDYAVAALLLNLVQPTLDVTSYRTVYGANGLPYPGALLYDNILASVSLSTLWAQLQTPPNLVSNVYQLRQTFLSPPLVYDLDKDGTNDVASFDIPFILHGFYPVDGDQQRSDNAKYYLYDVNYATARGQSPRDVDVGMTSHLLIGSDGTTKEFLPRYKAPLAPSANLGIAVIDQGGNPVSGATITLTLSYPDGHQSTLTSVSANTVNQVHLELPQYYTYYLPPGTPLPACDPVNDSTIAVTLSATLNGVTSTNAPSFDNCAYGQAIAAAAGPVAMYATLNLPIAVSAFTVGGTVTGLSGSLTLLNNNGAPLVITANGPFTFPGAMPGGSAYSVTVSAQPPGRSCSVANGSGTVGDSNVSSIAVACVPAQEDITASLSFSESGIVLNRASGTFNFTVTFTNTSSSTYGAPLWLLISGLPSGTTLANASGTTNSGIPYIAVAAPSGQLAPGASVTQLVAVSNPARVGLKPLASVWGYAP